MTDRAAGTLSRDNARVKNARRLLRRTYRHSTGLFLAEGPRAVESAAAAGVVDSVFVSPDFVADADVRARVAATRARWDVVDDATMRSLSSATTPPGIVAVCRRMPDTWAALPESASLLAVCVDVRDPGNAGTIIRTADAAGAAGVVLAGESVDAYNPKVVRSTAGSLFHLPVVIEPDAAVALARCHERGMQVLGADGYGTRSLFDTGTEFSLARPTAWVFGNEAQGLAEATRSRVDELVHIPLYGGAESLNLAAAAAVCLFGSARELFA